MTEPTLSDVHADLVGRFEHDKRLRLVEQGQARTEAVIADLPRMEERIMKAIGDAKPKPWAGNASAIVSMVALLLIVAERLYS